MRRLLPSLGFGLLLVWGGLLPASAEAQAIPHLSDAALTLYAAVHKEITEVRDEMHQELSRVANKIEEAQVEIRAGMRERILAIFQAHGLPEEEYDAITFILSVDDAQQARLREIQADGGGGAQVP